MKSIAEQRNAVVPEITRVVSHEKKLINKLCSRVGLAVRVARGRER